MTSHRRAQRKTTIVARLSAILAALACGGPARAQEVPAHHAATADDDPGQLPYTTPRETLIPGTPGMPGGFHFMVNAFAHAQNTGLGAHRIDNPNVKSWNGGATYPLLSDDWVMGYGRDAGGWVEGLVMLDFEPFTIGGAGMPELGQSGEGL